jgi:capsular exopolysaccharide synthesis family protein
MDTRVDSGREEVELRSIPEEQAVEDFPESLVTVSAPTSATAQAYYTLGTNLRNGLAGTQSKVIVLTSPDSSDGKNTVCANLGVALARTGSSVLIMDCDLHRPTVHELFGLRNLRGLENVLAGERGLREVQQEPLANLRVVTTGPIPPYPAELLSSRQFKEFVHEASTHLDYVLIDSPPVTVAPDSLILAAQGDGVLLVLDAQSTPKEAVRRAMRGLESVHANVLGTVVDNA